MRMELVSIPTDTEPLDGLWYDPQGPERRGVVLLLHGNTMNFYVGPPRFLPPALTARGFACLAFNRRGHDILSTRDSRLPEGGAFQTAAEGLADTVFAAGHAAARGGGAVFLVGHSNGGTLAAAHAAASPEVRGLVLLSAHLGGPTILAVQSAAGQLAADRLPETVARAERLVGEGRGDELLLVPGWWYAISAASLLDRRDCTPDLLALAPRVRCPSLFVRGDAEPVEVYPAERFAAAAGGPCEVAVLPNCDHFYVGSEAATADLVSGWLSARAEEDEHEHSR
jgi:pimeloyl-ACP methyl ester carboxylesterase